MKRATALRYVREVARRIRSVNGLLATPVCQSEAVRIRRAWVFGSTVKGSQTPNDVDILLDIEPVGRRRTWRQTRADKGARRNLGCRVAPCSLQYALKWLTRGMKKVSRHTVQSEGAAPFPEQVLIYPRDDFSGSAKGAL